MTVKLKQLVLNEVSLVDRGANQHAHIALFKRDNTMVAGDAADKADEGQHKEKAMSEAENYAKLEKSMTDLKAEYDTAVAKHAKEMEAISKTMTELTRENALLKMTPEHNAYMAESGMSREDSEAFIVKTAEERESVIKANPIEKKLPASVLKALDEAKADREVLKSLREKDEIATFAKRAEELGCSATAGETFRKAYHGDAEAIKALETMVKGLNEQVHTGKVFEEFGTTQGGTTDAYGLLKVKATELRKIVPELTEASAFEKVYTDPANRELVKQYKTEKKMPNAA